MTAKQLPPMDIEALRSSLRRYVQQYAGGNQSDAATRLGISQGLISHIFSGRTNPGMRVARALAEATGLSIDVVTGRLPWPSDGSAAKSDRYPNKRVAILAWLSVQEEEHGEDPAMLAEVVAELEAAEVTLRTCP